MKLFRKAILVIHGFTGNLYDNEYLVNFLQLDANYDVYARTLPGHNKERFKGAKVDDWKKSVDNQVQELIDNGYRTIYVVGHSMGGILATYVAGKYPQIKKVVLINAAFLYANTKQEGSDDYSKFGKLWEKILRTSPFIFVEFNKIVKESQKFLPKVSCPVLILRSEKDEVVPYKTGDLIYEKTNSNDKWITDVKGVGHTLLSSEKKEEVSGYIKDFLKGGRRWKKNKKKEI